MPDSPITVPPTSITVPGGDSPTVPITPNADLPQGLSQGLQPQQTLPLPAQTSPSDLGASPNAVQHSVGHAFGKILGGLSGGHNEYEVDPTTGRTVSTFVKDPPGQTMRSILALGLLGGQGIGTQYGQKTFAQGLMAGLGGGVKTSMERSDLLDKQRRAQAQEQFQNQMKANEDEREKQKLTMQQELNRAAIAAHNQEMVLKKQQFDKVAYDFAKEKGIDASQPLLQHSHMLVEADAPKIDGFKSLNVDPIASGLTEQEMFKYLQDHPGAATKEMAFHTGTRQTFNPQTGEMKVEDLYSIYPPMTKVPPSLLQQLRSDGADKPGSTLHNVYKSLFANGDGSVGTEKLLSVYRDMTNWENLQKASLDRRFKESEIAKNYGEAAKDKLELQLKRLQFDADKDMKLALDLYNRAYDSSTGAFRADVMQALQPKLKADGSPATPQDAEKLHQRDLLNAAITSQITQKTAELYDKGKVKKDAMGNLVTDDPITQMQLGFIKNLKTADQQLLHPQQYQDTQALLASIPNPKVRTMVQALKENNITDPLTIAQSLKGVPSEDQLQVYKALGIQAPSPEQMEQISPSGQTNIYENPIAATIDAVKSNREKNPGIYVPSF